MKTVTLLTLMGLPQIIAAKSNSEIMCGNERMEYPAHLKQHFNDRRKRSLLRRQNNNTTSPSQYATKIIKTYFHLIGSTAEENEVALNRSQPQLDALNFGFRNTGFQFTLEGVYQHVNETWAVIANKTVEMEMKRVIRNGTYADLNLYFPARFQRSNSNPVGECWYPSMLPGDRYFIRDGCTMKVNSMTGTERPHLTPGYTVVHEVGHWLGLNHVWGDEDGSEDPRCQEDDFVEDTPRQLSPTRGCPSVATNSCPGFPGVDNISNFMDYSDDQCQTGFTKGQIEAMHQIWDFTRSGMSLPGKLIPLVTLRMAKSKWLKGQGPASEQD